jgi:hypothetical protein
MGTFNHISGNTRISRGNLNTLNLTSGTFNVTGNTGNTDLGNFLFEGGTITSTGISKTVTAKSVLLTGQDLKTISSVTLSSADIVFRCGNECELVLLQASLITTKIKSKVLF